MSAGGPKGHTSFIVIVIITHKTLVVEKHPGDWATRTGGALEGRTSLIFFFFRVAFFCFKCAAGLTAFAPAFSSRSAMVLAYSLYLVWGKGFRVSGSGCRVGERIQGLEPWAPSVEATLLDTYPRCQTSSTGRDQRAVIEHGSRSVGSIWTCAQRTPLASHSVWTTGPAWPSPPLVFQLTTPAAHAREAWRWHVTVESPDVCVVSCGFGISRSPGA